LVKSSNARLESEEYDDGRGTMGARLHGRNGNLRNLVTKLFAFGKENLGPQTFADKHRLWFDRGNLFTSPPPGGKMRLDLILPDTGPPDHSSGVQASNPRENASDPKSGLWNHVLLQVPYSRSSTVEIFRNHAIVYHPVIIDEVS